MFLNQYNYFSLIYITIFFLFLLDLTLIMSLCKILYIVASVALALRSFHIYYRFFLRSIL